MPAHVPPVADEREALLGFLHHQRQALRVACYGLTDTQAGATPSASALSLGGLVKHLAGVERNWRGIVLGPSAAAPGDGQRDVQAATEDYLDGFRLRPAQTLAEVMADYEAAAAETDAVLGGIDDLGQPVPVPKGVPWFPQDVEAWSVRWVLLHLIEETARHAGHADIIRKSVDGATYVSLLAAAEGWPATPWAPPWRPAVATG